MPKKYIRKNYADEGISLNTTARSVNLSPNHFGTIFSQETGGTSIEYLTSLRMEKVREMLRCTNTKTSEIAYCVGYKYNLCSLQEGATNEGPVAKRLVKEVGTATLKRVSAVPTFCSTNFLGYTQ